jgi:predicted permease
VAEWFSSLRLRLRALVRRDRQEQDLQDEIAFHLAMREAQLRGSGATNAGAGARRQFGSAGRIRDEMRDVWAVVPRLGSLLQDIRHSARALVRSGTFAVVVVLTLAFGIGANTAVFSIVNAVLIRPLGFADPDRLVVLHEGVPAVGIERVPFSPADLHDVEREVRSLDGVGSFRTVPFELSGRGGEPERIQGAKVTASLFPLLGVKPALGRLYSVGEDRPGNDLAVMSWALWQRRYAGNPGVIGQSILLDRRAYTVIGVMPATFAFPRRGLRFNSEPGDVWVPMAFTDGELAARGGGFANSVVARLKDGATLSAAQAELDVLAPRLQAQYPVSLRNRDVAPLLLFANPLREEIVGAVGRPLLMLLGAIGLVLLVACANVANLLLSRAAARQHEIGLRVALGASRVRLFQLQLSEVLLLTMAGAVFGVLVARLALDAMPAVVAEQTPGLHDVPIDLRVLAFTAGLSIGTAILFAVVPFLATERRPLLAILHESAARTTAGLRRHRIQSALVVSTVALCFVLLIGAGLLLRSFSAVLSSDPGFRSAGVLTAEVALPQEAYPTAASVRVFYDSLLQRMDALPGVQSATVATDLPLESETAAIFTPEGADLGGIVPPTRSSRVHGAYFQTLGIALRRGRLFSGDELAEDRQVVIVNEKLASRYWPGEDPIGKRLKWGAAQNSNPWLTVVGVVSDTVDGREAVATMGDDRPVYVYAPVGNAGPVGRDIKLAVLTRGDPTTLAGPVRREVANLDPQLAVARIATMEDRLNDVYAPQRFSTALVATFAGGALVLVAIGLYGLLAFVVAQRTREIGVRLALGAEPRTVVRLMLVQGGKLVGAGLGAGFAAALATTRFLSSFLHETGSYDPLTFVVVAVVLAGVALLACGLPARRASRVDPLVALRSE